MSFKKNKYIVVKKAISPQLAKFITQYFSLKRKVFRTLLDKKYLSQFTEEWGTWGDDVAATSYCHYSDIAMETLLTWVQPIMEKETGFKLHPTYTYTRFYQKEDELVRHKDRFSCEISTTLRLGGDKWPIYLSPYENVGRVDGKKLTNRSEAKGVSIDLNLGDLLVYSGCELEHWREPFQGESCLQVFLHYNKANSKEAKENEFDTRPHLGLPAWFKKRLSS